MFELTIATITIDLQRSFPYAPPGMVEGVVRSVCPAPQDLTASSILSWRDAARSTLANSGQVRVDW